MDGSIDSLSHCGTAGVVAVAPLTDALSLFQTLLPSEHFDGLRHRGTLRENNRVYNAAVVMWLTISQRMRAGTMATSVLELIRGLPSSFWPLPCKRLQAGPDGRRKKLSENPTSYHDALQTLPVRVVELSFDQAFAGMMTEAKGKLPEVGEVFFVDGTSARTAHSPSLCEVYPVGKNAGRKTHWPVLRVLVAHDACTGLAMRPHWGPMYGPEAVSEQGLLVNVLDRLPGGATLLGDINFGVFWVAYTADQKGHPLVLRLQSVRAQRLLGGPLQDGMDRRIEWRPSSQERKSHQLPADACVVGRVIVRQVQPSNGDQPLLLALFTTLAGPPEEIVPIYGKRWNIETDLRSLKSDLRLEQLTFTSPEMVAKELILGMLAYNLIRAVTYLAAQATGLAPRAFSFTQVRNVINAFGPLIAAARDPQEAQRQFENMMYYASRARLPKRRQPRSSSPRVAWGKPRTFPKPKE